MIQSETVPVVGDGDMVTTYDYVDGAKVRTSPTLITYQWWNSQTSAYESKSIVRHYDDMGRLISETDARGNATTTAYTRDGADNLVTTTFPLTLPDTTQRTRIQRYGCCGLSEEKDENDHITHYAYEGGKVKKMWTDLQYPEIPLVSYNYDTFGHTTDTLVAKNDTTVRTTSYGYDGVGRVTSIDHPGSLGIEESQYDAVGNLLGKKDGNGAVTAYEYDALNRVRKVKYNYGHWPVDLDQYPITTPDVTYSYYKDTSSVLEMVSMSSDYVTPNCSMILSPRLSSRGGWVVVCKVSFLLVVIPFPP